MTTTRARAWHIVWVFGFRVARYCGSDAQKITSCDFVFLQAPKTKRTILNSTLGQSEAAYGLAPRNAGTPNSLTDHSRMNAVVRTGQWRPAS